MQNQTQQIENLLLFTTLAIIAEKTINIFPIVASQLFSSTNNSDV